MPVRTFFAPAIAAIAALSLGQVTSIAAAAAASEAPNAVDDLIPSTAFAQAGIGDQHTHAYIGGFTWDWPWRHDWGPASLSGYFEAAFGRWTTDEHGVEGNSWMTQIGLTPVLRARPGGSASAWFAEIGVGPNFILPLYRSGRKRFSTEFNFGDEFGFGRDFGARRQHELALRAEHFSNAGIEHPNPGENFAQLRYSYRF
jgi:hypothetical protein